MSDGIIFTRSGGQRIDLGGVSVTVKTVMNDGAFAASFELVIPPGYDVGAHVHTDGAEMFYIVEGQLDLLAFEPVDRSVEDWHQWRSRTGQGYLRAGPGSFLFVPKDTPHAFANLSDEPTTVFFQSSATSGHENYFIELATLLNGGGSAQDPTAVAELRRRYNMQHITGLRRGTLPTAV
jgi:uncharacterized RmlC-like cupin family protein